MQDAAGEACMQAQETRPWQGWGVSGFGSVLQKVAAANVGAGGGGGAAAEKHEMEQTRSNVVVGGAAAAAAAAEKHERGQKHPDKVQMRSERGQAHDESGAA
eukprot:1143827-Pelagomonas_calceolata.AAC.4